MQYVERKQYINQLKAFKDKNIIKVVTGIRRCGKTVLFSLYKEYLKNEGVEADRIVSLNFEDYDLEELLDSKKLHTYLKNCLDENKMTYIFLDEVQLVDSFERVIDSIYIKPNVDIYITGSNSNLLSSEIATMLSGRFVEIRMLPLSFKEFYSSFNGTLSPEGCYNTYSKTGGFPFVLSLLDNANKSIISEYLQGIYNTVIVKDIQRRKSITDIMLLESVIKFLYSSIGSPISVKKISDTLTSNNRKTDYKTVEKYLSSLVESFLLYKVPRYDVKGKEQLKTLDKYYGVDIGLRRFLLGAKGGDEGHILENIIYLELLKRGYEIYVGKCNNMEIDFVATKDVERLYIQVALTVRDEITLSRELKPLIAARDNYKKILITLDNTPQVTHNGIDQYYAIDWLLQD